MAAKKKKATSKKPSKKPSKPAPKPKKKAAVKAKPTTKPTPKPKLRETPPTSVPPPAPSDRALRIAGARPRERALTDEERTAMDSCSGIAQRYLDADGTPEEVVRRIAIYVDDVRSGRVPEPKNQDLRIGIGVLWGEQIRAQVGWRWVHLAYGDGFASYAMVPDDRAFACFPLNRLPEIMTVRSTTTDTTNVLFQRIRSGELPMRTENAYLVIG